MACKQVNNCDEFPNYPCYDTEKQCLCNCDGSKEKGTDACKCVDEEKNCVNGRVRKTDCQCFCGVGKYLDKGVCYRYRHDCANNCAYTKTGAYGNRADCKANCGGGGGDPPFCFPTPMPPVGTPIFCPDGSQIGLIAHYFDPFSCSWIPWENRWGTCGGTNPPPPPRPSSSTGAGDSSSSGTSCDCSSIYPQNESKSVCGKTVPTVLVNSMPGECSGPPCSPVSITGGFTLYEWCDTCDKNGDPVLKQVQAFGFMYTSPYDPCQVVCGFQQLNLGEEIGGPFPCPPPTQSSSSSRSSTSSDSSTSDSSGSCGATGSTQITFIGQTGTGASLNNFREDDYVRVTMYTANLTEARESETKWTFYTNYGTPPTRYDITTGDFTDPAYPGFIVTSKRLLSLIDLTFETGPNGSYPFEMCAEATNCAGLYDSYCSPIKVTVRITQSNNSSSSSGVSSSSNSFSSSSSAFSSSSNFSSSSSSVSQTANNRLLFFVGFRPNGAGPFTDWGDRLCWRYGSIYGPVPNTLPNSTDDVIILATIETNADSANTAVNTLTTQNVFGREDFTLEIAFTAINGATLNAGSALTYNNATTPPRQGKITGNVVFNNYTSLAGGLVTGSAIFNNTTSMAVVSSVITGHATFNDTSVMANGYVYCGATFNDQSARRGGEIYGPLTCNNGTNPCGTSTPNTCSPALVIAGAPEFKFPECPQRCSVFVYTSALPPECTSCPDGWDYVNGRCEKTVGEYESLSDCTPLIWAIKAETTRIDQYYRLMVQGNNEEWYAPALYFNYQLCRQTMENGECQPLDCTLIPEEFFDNMP